MSYKEIGGVMKLSEQVVRNYSHRALQKLRSQESPEQNNNKKEIRIISLANL